MAGSAAQPGAAGLATREPGPTSVRIAATDEAVRVMEMGREPRVRALVKRLGSLSDAGRRTLARAIGTLEQVVR